MNSIPVIIDLTPVADRVVLAASILPEFNPRASEPASDVRDIAATTIGMWCDLIGVQASGDAVEVARWLTQVRPARDTLDVPTIRRDALASLPPCSTDPEE